MGLVGTIPPLFDSTIQSHWGSILVPVNQVSNHSWDLGLVATPTSGFRSAIRSQSFNGPRLIWLSDSPRRPLNLQSSIGSGPTFAVHRCKHAAVGGVTSSITTFVTLGISSFSIPSSVQRSLSSVIDHKLYLPPGDFVPSDLSLDDYLNPKFPYQHIRLPSRFSPTGYGRRSLSFGELCLAWDLPLWSIPSRVSKVFFESVSTFSPIKSLSAVLAGVISTLDMPSGPPVGLPPCPALHLPTTDSRGTWLPTLNAWLPPSWIDETLVTEKAVKVDDSDVPTHLWDLRISLVLQSPTLLLDRLRDFMHRVACRRVFRSLTAYLARTHPTNWTSWVHQSVNRGGSYSYSFPSAFLRDLAKGRAALHHYVDSSWWKWTRGSALLFWRWPPSSIESARDGFRIWISSQLPTYKRKQKHLNSDLAMLVANKIGDVRWKGYISPIAFTHSDVDYFPVPKGIDPDTGAILDVRMVYNGTSSGLNAAVWAPSFWMPSPSTATRQVTYGSYMIDLDLGEFFLNFPLSEMVRPYAGVRMETIKTILNSDPKQDPVQRYEAWARLLMGFRPSPFCAVRHFYLAEEFVFGNPRDLMNSMRWDHIILNLPGMKSFDPRMPWVYLWDDIDQCIAGIVITFVDDGRGSGRSAEHAWLVGRQYATRLQYLGIQHATRKIRPPSQEPGAWAGMILKTSDGRVVKSSTQAKWDKIIPILDRIELQIEESD